MLGALLVIVAIAFSLKANPDNAQISAPDINVTSMTGGVTEWSNLGYPIEETRP